MAAGVTEPAGALLPVVPIAAPPRPRTVGGDVGEQDSLGDLDLDLLRKTGIRELIGPRKNMNRRMNAMSQCAGVATCSAST